MQKYARTFLPDHTQVDDDDNGFIDASELRDLMEVLNLDITDDELQRMIGEIDSTGKGTIGFDQFVQVVTRKVDHGNDVKKDDLVAAFARFENGAPAGFIYAKNLARVLMEHGHVEEAMAKKMICQMEPNQKGLVNYRAYVDLFLL